MKLLVVLAACSHPARTSIANHAPNDYVGSYRCGIDDGGELAACSIARAGERLELAKTSGPQRFSGTLTAEPGGFAFAGMFSCSHLVDCKVPVTGHLRAIDAGGLAGELAASQPYATADCVEQCGTRDRTPVSMHPGVPEAGQSYGGVMP